MTLEPGSREALARAMNPRPKTPAPPVLKPVVDEPWRYPDACAEVDTRSGGLCECNGAGRPGCGQIAQVHHHIAGRGGANPHHPDNLLHLTVEHHQAIHANPEDSYEAGTMRRRVR